MARSQGDEGGEGMAHLRLRRAHLSESSTHMNRKRTRGARLDLDLSHLERAERDVREELGRRGSGKLDRALVAPFQARFMYWSLKAS